MRPRIARIALLGVVVGMLGCDHATKGLAESELAGGEPMTLVSGVVDFRYAQNHGMAFNLERWVPEPARRPLVLGGALLALLLILVTWRRWGTQLSLHTLGFAIILAGALGNLLDRLIRGYVVDFIHVHFWPVFNVADICVVVGAGLVMLAMIRDNADPGRRPAAT